MAEIFRGWTPKPYLSHPKIVIQALRQQSSPLVMRRPTLGCALLFMAHRNLIGFQLPALESIHASLLPLPGSHVLIATGIGNLTCTENAEEARHRACHPIFR